MILRLLKRDGADDSEQARGVLLGELLLEVADLTSDDLARLLRVVRAMRPQPERRSV